MYKMLEINTQLTSEYGKRVDSVISCVNCGERLTDLDFDNVKNYYLKRV